VTTRVVRSTAALLAILQGSCAFAQTSGSVSLVSDYRFRGESLSDGDPEPQFSVSYDHPSGWYAGAFASGVKLGAIRDDTQANAYAGYAGRLNSRASWELGFTKSIFIRTERLNYQETYAGIAFDNLEGRVYFSPDYFGRRVPTVYMEINGSYPLSERLRLTAHFGALSDQADHDGLGNATQRDYRIGFSTSFANWNVQLEWVTSEQKLSQYSIYGYSSPPTLVFAASHSF
jgi:uncharacterized protein (TIGR02001 family)